MKTVPTVIDLFAGAGGLSLGTCRAGFHVAASVEVDPQALETHKRNFPRTKHLDADISKLQGTDLLNFSGLRKGALSGLIGGPPCQGFSWMGKRDEADERNNLFVHFFRLVKEVQPAFFMAENVPGILDDIYAPIRQMALSQVESDYVVLDTIKVTASDYGAPTSRTRVFFIGYKKDAKLDLSIETFLPSLDAQKVDVQTALKGLPERINPLWQLSDGWCKRGKMPISIFAGKISGEIPDGVGHQDSLARYYKTDKVSGCLGTLHSPEIIARYASLAPGQQDGISKAVRLNLNGLCPTLRAGTGKDKGSYQAVRPIHPTEPRVITPREAARLQGFPDWFVFHETKWHSFRQIGNSVSPLVAEFLMSALFKKLSLY